jgi:hypothetical protein
MTDWIDYFEHYQVKPNSGGYFIVRKDGSVTFTKYKPEDMKIIDGAEAENNAWRRLPEPNIIKTYMLSTLT